MTADIPLMLAPSGEPNEHVCKLHGVATAAAGAGHGGQYGYTQVWQLRTAPDVAAAAAPGLGEYQATDDNGLETTTSRPGHATRRTTPSLRRDHLYDCPLFDDRLLPSRNHLHSPGCRRHQVNSSRDLVAL